MPLPADNPGMYNRTTTTKKTSTTHQPTYSRALKAYPTRKQAILFPSYENIPILDYVVAVGRLIGPDKILSASKIAKQRICIYLNTEDTADSFVHSFKNIQIEGKTFEATKLSAPARRLVLSNVHPCVPNSLILEALHEAHIKTKSAIHELHIGLTSNSVPKEESNKYSHVTSFRRGVYVENNAEITIPESLLIHFENETYRIFVTDSEQKCHVCKQANHNASNCPHFDDLALQTESDITANEHQEIPFSVKLQAARQSRDTNKNPTETEAGTSTAPINTKQSPIAEDSNQSRPANQTTSLCNETGPIATNNNRELDNVDESTNLDMELDSPRTVKRSRSLTSSISTSSAGKTSTPKKKKGTETKTEDTITMLKPLKDTIDSKFPTNKYPINFNTLCILMDSVHGVQHPQDIVLKYTSDISGVLRILDDNYLALKNRVMKTRFTKLKKRLLNAYANAEKDYRNTSEDSDLEDNSLETSQVLPQSQS